MVIVWIRNIPVNEYDDHTLELWSKDRNTEKIIAVKAKIKPTTWREASSGQWQKLGWYNNMLTSMENCKTKSYKKCDNKNVFFSRPKGK